MKLRCSVCGTTLSALAMKKCCGKSMFRDGSKVSAVKMEVLDNGLMARAVERISDVGRMLRERNRGEGQA